MEGTRFIRECRVFWRILDYCICLEESAWGDLDVIWGDLYVNWLWFGSLSSFDFMPEESALGMRDALSGKCCLLCLLWMILSWRESAFELCAFGGKWLSNLIVLAGCAFWSNVWCLLSSYFLSLFDGLMPFGERMECYREVAFIILILVFGFVRPLCCFAFCFWIRIAFLSSCWRVFAFELCCLDALSWWWCLLVMESAEKC